jgi:hypothetical protein
MHPNTGDPISVGLKSSQARTATDHRPTATANDFTGVSRS